LKKIKFLDSTLRDGSHALHQQLFKEDISYYCSMIDGSGVHTVIVGHGNGLGASSIQMGLSAMPDMEMLKTAKKTLNKTSLGAFVTVGFGTIEDHIEPAIQCGTEVFCIASHCTEADTMHRHIEYLAQQGKEVYGVLMNYHLAKSDVLLEEAKKIQSYGADGVILMDSAGASTPNGIKEVISKLYDRLNIEIGFHAHNNMGIAVANSYSAIECGASIIDGTIGGFGAGAGNCQIEALAALLKKENIDTNLNLYQMLDTYERVIKDRFSYEKGIDSTSIISGFAGVVSTFKPRVERIAKQYSIDPRDIFVELGKRKVVAGQDDLILEVAESITKENKKSRRII